MSSGGSLILFGHRIFSLDNFAYCSLLTYRLLNHWNGEIFLFLDSNRITGLAGNSRKIFGFKGLIWKIFRNKDLGATFWVSVGISAAGLRLLFASFSVVRSARPLDKLWLENRSVLLDLAVAAENERSIRPFIRQERERGHPTRIGNGTFR